MNLDDDLGIMRTDGRDPDDERDDMLCEQDDERRRRLAADLDGVAAGLIAHERHLDERGGPS